jgi:lysozyme
VPIDDIRSQLIRDEDCILHAYPDHLGFLTIGVGRLIDKRKGGGISRTEAEYLLDNDIAKRTSAIAQALPWTAALDEARRGVLVNMAFQMGVNGLLGFKNTLAAFERKDWPAVAAGMRDSDWHEQTPNRADRLIEQVLSGEWK